MMMNDSNKREGWSEKGVDSRWVQSLLHASRTVDQWVHSSDCNQSNRLFPTFYVTCLQLYCKFCHKATHHPHQHHLLLPFYKASRETCLQANDHLSNLIDISDIHPFIINQKQVVFINTRPCDPKPKSGRTKSSHACKTCGREFQRPKKFCSIQCKNESGENLEPKQKPEAPAANAQSYRKRKRKGIPRRAPFF